VIAGPTVDRRLSEFVDRDREMAEFRAMLASDEKSIMVVWGELGIGKTWLRMRMVHECSIRGIRKSEVDWMGSYSPDYRRTMGKIRDDIGAACFNHYTDLVNFFYQRDYQPQFNVTVNVQGSIAVGTNMSVERGNVGDVAGIVIKDCMMADPRTDIAIEEQERRRRLTERFLQGLQGAAGAGPIVVFFDGVERMSRDTEAWIWEQLLEAPRSGSLKQVKFVLLGEKRPPSEGDWMFCMSEAELRPLGHADIVKYIMKRLPDEGEKSVVLLADLILDTTGGRAAAVAAMVQATLKARARRIDANG
jgi:hypothetical protein